MDRSQKADAVAELNRTFNEVGVVVVTRNLGMTVKQSTDLRNKMRAAGATYKVSKNKLAKIATQGTDYAVLADLLTGPTALSYSTDPVAAAMSGRKVGSHRALTRKERGRWPAAMARSMTVADSAM